MDTPFDMEYYGPVARLVALGFVAAGCLVVGCNGDQGATPGTSSVVEAETSTTTSSQTDILAMTNRIAGHTVSYRMELESPAFTGVWKIVERDGKMLEVEYLGHAEPHEDKPWLDLSQALKLAKDADRAVVVVNDSATTIRLTVDSDINTIDDEFLVYASDITIVS